MSGRLIRTTTSAGPFRRATVTSPLATVRYHRSTRSPSSTSKRSVADSPSNVSRWPGWARTAKNLVTGSDARDADLASAFGIGPLILRAVPDWFAVTVGRRRWDAIAPNG